MTVILCHIGPALCLYGIAFSLKEQVKDIYMSFFFFVLFYPSYHPTDDQTLPRLRSHLHHLRTYDTQMASQSADSSA